jgi:hypothetical protein
MVELLRYLEANEFATYIASGGDRDFMRPFAGQVYGIPPERVIGSALGLGVDTSGPDTRLVYALRLLVRHDDADREFALTAGAEDAVQRAQAAGWTTVSIRDDWATVFAGA